MSGVKIRICDVFGTSWRVPPETALKSPDDFILTKEFKSFYQHQEGLPSLLAQLRRDDGEGLSIEKTTSGSEDSVDEQQAPLSFRGLTSVEVVLFALPIPVSQVVAAVVLDFDEDAVSNDNDSRIPRLRDALLQNEIRIDGRKISEIVDQLSGAAGAVRGAAGGSQGNRLATGPAQNTKKKRRWLPWRKGSDQPAALPRALSLDEERHLLIFAHPHDPSLPRPADLDEQARALIYGSHWPHQPEFATIEPPKELNDERRYAAVSRYASVLYGHSPEVDSSVLLITAQTVGTAARFQLIWRSAYEKVTEFQRDRLEKESGKQTRQSLAPLADDMGNLELDLTFNVQTAADLGLGSTTAFVDSFQRCLHEAMKFKHRASTVAEMFERVNSSIQSELTAIVSRERETEERRRVWGGAVIGILTFLLAPATVIFGYFGVNTSDVNKDDSIKDFRHFWVVYALAGVLMVVALLAALLLMRSTPPKLELDTITARRKKQDKKLKDGRNADNPLQLPRDANR